MTKIIQTRVDANGDVHLDFAGFVGHDCQLEEDRLRRELASLGLNVNVRISPKSREVQVGAAEARALSVQ